MNDWTKTKYELGDDWTAIQRKNLERRIEAKVPRRWYDGWIVLGGVIFLLGTAASIIGFFFSLFSMAK